MNRRFGSIARASLVTAAMPLVLAACGGNVGSTEEGVSGTPAATTEPASETDPLEGEWHAEYTCRESVRAAERAHVRPKQFIAWTGDFADVWPTLEPTKGDPCRGAVGTLAVLVRFSDGKLALFDAETGELGAQATYEFLDDHTMSVDDKEDNLCDAGRCPVTWKFEMTGDRLTFDLLARDPWIVGAWEAVPFQRVS